MKKLILLAISTFLISPFNHAQGNKFWISNGVELEDDRYIDYKNSPYTFEEFMQADITSYEGEIFENISTNYNAFTQDIEVISQGKYYLLNEKLYLIIKILKEKNEDLYKWKDQTEIIFKRGFHPQFLENFVEMIYDGQLIKLVKELRSASEEKVFQDVGKTIKIKRFNSKDKYYLIIEGEVKEIKLNKKDFLKAFDQRKEIESILKEKDIKLKEPSHFAQILKIIEETSLR